MIAPEPSARSRGETEPRAPTGPRGKMGHGFCFFGGRGGCRASQTAPVPAPSHGRRLGWVVSHLLPSLSPTMASATIPYLSLGDQTDLKPLPPWCVTPNSSLLLHVMSVNAALSPHGRCSFAAPSIQAHRWNEFLRTFPDAKRRSPPNEIPPPIMTDWSNQLKNIKSCPQAAKSTFEK